jgi:hypothetical protein
VALADISEAHELDERARLRRVVHPHVGVAALLNPRRHGASGSCWFSRMGLEVGIVWGHVRAVSGNEKGRQVENWGGEEVGGPYFSVEVAAEGMLTALSRSCLTRWRDACRCGAPVVGGLCEGQAQAPPTAGHKQGELDL